MSKRDTEKFPTRFGPPTTRMPAMPNGRGAPTTGKFGVESVPGKRRSTWKEREPEGRVEPEQKGQPVRGLKGPKRMRSLRTKTRRKVARKISRQSRKINRRNA
jgi:hypothetical protein